MNARPYLDLRTAARELGIEPAALQALCEGPNIDYHGFKVGDFYVISAETVERRKMVGGTALET